MSSQDVANPEELLTIIDELISGADQVQGRRPSPWQILVVDDEASVHDATAFALEGLMVLGQPLAFLHAYDEAHAQEIIAQRDDVAVILLDVVMDREDSGLRLVRYIREALGRRAVRIILHTGQPGYAPEMEVIQEYDINDYKMKSELTRARLATTMVTAIRSYRQIRTIESGQRTLEKIVSGAAELFARRGLANFCDALLLNASELPGEIRSGLVALPGHACADGNRDATLQVVSATGDFVGQLGQPLDRIDDPVVVRAVLDALDAHAHCVSEDALTLFLSDSTRMPLLVHLRLAHALQPLERHLIEVFAANAAVAFENVRLLERLRMHAYVDQLTGLPNRNRFVHQIDERILLGRSDWVVAIIDIVQFADTNDSMGHANGDLLLKAMAARLGQCSGTDAAVARVAGDSFGVLAPAAAIDPERLQTLLARPFRVGTYPLQVQTSIGLVRLADSRGSGLDALKDASIGLGRAKLRKGSFCYYTPEMEAATQERVRMAADLRVALQAGELLLHYQPQIALATGRVVGAEALLRWRGVEGAFIPPHVFIPVAESAGLIQTIGEWVLRTAAAQLQLWRERGLHDFRMAVNVSIDQFRAPKFCALVRSVVAGFGFDPRQLELEITESIAMDDLDAALEIVKELHAIGVAVAIDDFGTGASSLAYLHRLSVDRLKIDRAFVQDMPTGNGSADAGHASIADMIVRLGHNLKLQVIAEGVETAAQLEALRVLGCDEAQGYHICHPIPTAAFEQWLRGRGMFLPVEGA